MLSQHLVEGLIDDKYGIQGNILTIDSEAIGKKKDKPTKISLKLNSD